MTSTSTGPKDDQSSNSNSNHNGPIDSIKPADGQTGHAAATSLSPSETDLVAELRTIRNENAMIGVTKFLPLLKERKPEWSVSEKRIKKLLQQEGLMVGGQEDATKIKRKGKEVDTGYSHPKSYMNDSIDVRKWTSKVDIKRIDDVKGKGLFATEQIKEGEVIWKEDPWILAADWYCFFL